MQIIEHHLFQRLFNLRLLLQNHTSLSLDMRLSQLGVLQHITQNIRHLSDILLERLGRKHRVFTRRVGIQLSSNILHLQLNILLATLRCSLEHHMLKEVRHSIILLSLANRSSINMNAKSHRLASRLLSRNTNTIRQGGNLGTSSIQQVGRNLDARTTLGGGRERALFFFVVWKGVERWGKKKNAG